MSIAKRTWVPDYVFTPYDKVLLDGAEITFVAERNGLKVFKGAESFSPAFALSNAEIADHLSHDTMDYVPAFYDPRKVVQKKTAPFLRDLSERQQKAVVHKLEVVHRYNRKVAHLGRVSSDNHMPAIMSSIGADYAAELTIARANSGKKKQYTYEDGTYSLVMPAARTIRDWRQKLREADDDWSSLTDGRGSGTRANKFTQEEQDIHQHFLTRLLTSTRTTPAYIHKKMKAVVGRINRRRKNMGLRELKIASRAHFYDLVKQMADFDLYAARKGDNAAKMKYFIVSGDMPRGMPLAIAEGDECLLDIVLLLKKADVWPALTSEERAAYRKAAKRFWVSAVVDQATTCFLAFRLHEQNPSLETAVSTFEMTTFDKTALASSVGCTSPWEMRGNFKEARIDSAAWFTSAAFRSTLTDAGYSSVYPPTKVPPLRGTIERMFAAIQNHGLQEFSGRTFSNVVVRGDADSRKEASVDIRKLGEVFLRVIVDVHHNTPNTGKLGGLTPRAAWLLWTKDSKVSPPPTGSLRRHIFGVNHTRVIQRDGIRFLGLRFQSREIQEMRRNDTDLEVRIRVDLWDLSEITVFHGSLSYSVRCTLKDMKGRDFWRWTATIKALGLDDAKSARMAQQVVDDTYIWIGEQADVARASMQIGTPIGTSEHLERLEKRIQQSIEIVEDNDHTAAVRDQDWSMSSFLAEAWGLSDDFGPDDLDIPASAIAAQERTAAGKIADKERRKAFRSQPTASSNGARTIEVVPANAPPDANDDDDDYYEEFL